MAEDLVARIAANAEAARVPIEPRSAERIARAVRPAIERFASSSLPLAMEVEPATFVAVQQREIER